MSDVRDKNHYNRNFTLLFYPDNEQHMKTLSRIKEIYSDYAYCLHDKDEFSNDNSISDDFEENHVKKAHYHCVIKFKNKRYISSVVRELEHDMRFIRACDLDSQLLYLIHFDDEDKFQYSIDDVCGTLKDRLCKLIKTRGKDEDAKAVDLLDFIDNSDKHITIREFSRYCAENGLWDVYRRGASIFHKCISEKNSSLGILASKQGFMKITDDDLLRALANYYELKGF